MVGRVGVVGEGRGGREGRGGGGGEGWWGRGGMVGRVEVVGEGEGRDKVSINQLTKGACSVDSDRGPCTLTALQRWVCSL